MESQNVQHIIQALRDIVDPELGVNIIDLGLVYDIQLKGGAVRITMTLTTPACPLDGYFKAEVEKRLAQIPDVVNAEIIFTFDPLWDKSRIAPEAKLQLGIS